MTIQHWLKKAVAQLTDARFEEPRLEADLLLTGILKWTRVQVLTQEQDSLGPGDEARLDQALRRRLSGEPLAYILGRKGFYKADFFVGPGVLVPRPETELVVETALALFAKNPPQQVADFGAGSGCIGLSLLTEWPRTKLTAIESSAAALSYLQRNIEGLGLRARVEVLALSVENFLGHDLDLIVANPPYIAADDSELEEGVKKFEPHQALFADQGGFGAIARWLEVGIRALRPGGHLVMEVGSQQSHQVEAWPTKELVFQAKHRDLSGHDRVMVWTKTNGTAKLR